jgi:hypothetical protein
VRGGGSEGRGKAAGEVSTWTSNLFIGGGVASAPGKAGGIGGGIFADGVGCGTPGMLGGGRTRGGGALPESEHDARSSGGSGGNDGGGSTRGGPELERSCSSSGRGGNDVTGGGVATVTAGVAAHTSVDVGVTGVAVEEVREALEEAREALEEAREALEAFLRSSRSFWSSQNGLDFFSMRLPLTSTTGGSGSRRPADAAVVDVSNWTSMARSEGGAEPVRW